MSAKSATSIIPSNPSRKKALRSMPGVTASENWPMKAGATSA